MAPLPSEWCSSSAIPWHGAKWSGRWRWEDWSWHPDRARGACLPSARCPMECLRSLDPICTSTHPCPTTTRTPRPASPAPALTVSKHAPCTRTGLPVASAAVVRLLLVVLLIHGMVPAFGEVAEAVVHYATSGHLAHSDADDGDLGDQGDEHGCSPTSHRCACCTPQPLVATPAGQVVRVTWTPRRLPPAAVGQVAVRSPDRPFRPPIA